MLAIVRIAWAHLAGPALAIPDRDRSSGLICFWSA
jgi:hypothetical protein